jgi:hypothetical protein
VFHMGGLTMGVFQGRPTKACTPWKSAKGCSSMGSANGVPGRVIPKGGLQWGSITAVPPIGVHQSGSPNSSPPRASTKGVPQEGTREGFLDGFSCGVSTEGVRHLGFPKWGPKFASCKGGLKIWDQKGYPRRLVPQWLFHKWGPPGGP